MKARARVGVAVLGLLAAALPACDGTSPAGLGLEDASSCSAAWQVLVQPMPYDITSGVVVQGLTLYYSSANAEAVLAQPTAGGAPSALASVFAPELWLEGDHLLYATGNLGNQIYSLPLAGGTPALVADGGLGRTSPGVAMAHAFDATDLYWTETSLAVADGPTTIWHQNRSGGAPEALGAVSFPIPDTASYPQTIAGRAIALTSDAALVGAAFGEADAVPLDGSTPSALAAPSASASLAVQSDLAGIDAQGVYWSIPGVGTTPASLVLSPADGGPARPVWPTQPNSVLVQHIWPDAEGGWVVVSLQTFSDGLDHTTITLLDAQGTATRLACSPGAGDGSWITEPVAVAPDAVYAAAANLGADTWEIDRIPR